jgi:DNA polymerase III subunit delta'
MSFNNLVGQQELRCLLTAALETGSLSHAVLLSGSAGSGKKSWGKALSQAILCPDRVGAEPCMQCRSCRSFLSGNHPDFTFLKPDGRKIKIDQIRAIRDGFYLSGSKKICLIDQADLMTAEASSSLLKILEEPPDGLYFILLTEQPRLLPDTVLSRCQRYTLHPLSIDEVAELLIRHRGVESETALTLARLSGGLPGNAFMLADDQSFEERFREAKELAYNLAAGRDSAVQLLSWAASLAEREDLTLFLELVCLVYRDGLVQNLSRRGDMNGKPDPGHTWIEAILPAGLEEAVLNINEAVRELNNTNVNRRLLMEKLLILLQRRLSKCQELSGSALDRRAKPTTLNPV